MAAGPLILKTALNGQYSPESAENSEMNQRCSNATHERNLEALVRRSSWCMSALAAARALNLIDWCIGAGAIRNLVWDQLHDRIEPTIPGDIDLAYFDPSDLSRERDAGLEKRLDGLFPGTEWDVVNQAGVHLWYAERFGQEVEPIGNLEEALSTWPEYATCVGVRLEPNDKISILAPHGLEDLFGMVVRRNPTRISRSGFLHRLEEKRFDEKWPLLRIHAEQSVD